MAEQATFKISLAPSARAKCKAGKQCENPEIAKGALRVSKIAVVPEDLPEGSRPPTDSHYHAECFFTLTALRSKTWSLDDVEQLEGLSDMKADDKEQIESLFATYIEEKAKAAAVPKKKRAAKKKAEEEVGEDDDEEAPKPKKKAKKVEAEE